MTKSINPALAAMASEIPARQRCVISLGWQRHAAKHGCVFAAHAISVEGRWVSAMLDGSDPYYHTDFLDMETATVYVDLMDVGLYGHPLLHHPSHPLHDRMKKVRNYHVDGCGCTIPLRPLNAAGV
jgi:hypothetical protein